MGALLAWALLDQRDWYWSQAVGQQWGLVAAKLLGLPVAAGWFAADLLERRRPRRIFDSRIRRPMAPIALGVLAGIVGVLLSGAAFAVMQALGVNWSGLPTDYMDAAIVGAAAAVSAASTVLLLRRARPRTCIYCGYDLSGAISGRCSECGAVGSLVRPAA